MNVNKNNFQKESSIISESDIVFDKDKEIKYKRGKRLGVGGFGEVYEFIEIDTNEKRAAKIISNSRINDPQSQNAFFYEKKFNELLGFKYLCKCYNIFNDDKNTYTQFWEGIFMHLNNLHKGKEYKLIYPSIVAEIHRFNSLLQSI